MYIVSFYCVSLCKHICSPSLSLSLSLSRSQEKLLSHLGVVLYEYLGEEYPEVLGSILAGLKAIVNVIGMTKMTPPIKDLLPRLTPILKNRFVTALRSNMHSNAVSSLEKARRFACICVVVGTVPFESR